MKKQWIFKSVFADEIIAYLNLRMSIGHRINNDRFVLHNLDSYLQTIELKEKHLPYSIIEEWFSTLAANTGANTAIVRISHYTQFANYLSSLGYHAFIPEKPGADHSYVPYIFSQRELDEIVKAADDTVKTSTDYGRHTAICCAIIIRILIGCGLRIGEALSLRTEDVDIETGVLSIRKAKENKDRLVPMHNSLTNVLRLYIESSVPQKDGLLFPSKRKMKTISTEVVRGYFNKYLELAGIHKPPLDHKGRNICIHCLRHTFAVFSFRQLHNEGYDLYDETPILSYYMGHENIYGTETYLHNSSEIKSDMIEVMEEYNHAHGIFPEVTR